MNLIQRLQETLRQQRVIREQRRQEMIARETARRQATQKNRQAQISREQSRKQTAARVNTEAIPRNREIFERTSPVSGTNLSKLKNVAIADTYQAPLEAKKMAEAEGNGRVTLSTYFKARRKIEAENPTLRDDRMDVALLVGGATGNLGPRRAIKAKVPAVSTTSPVASSATTSKVPLEASVQKVVAALKEAAPIRGNQEALYRAERAKRFARVMSTRSRVGGEKGFYAELGQLKGELPKAQYESIRPQVDQGDIDNLFNAVRDNRTIGEWDKISARSGLVKLFSKEGGGVPTNQELQLLNEVFGDELITTILSKRGKMDKFLDGVSQAWNLPKSLMSSIDLSAPLRQGLFLIGKPKQFSDAVGTMFKTFSSDKALNALKENIVTRPTYPLMREFGLAITDTGTVLQGREELFMSNWAEKIPVLGSGVKASNRGYVGFLNKLRADTFDDLYNHAKRQGLDPEANPKLMQDIAHFVNAATGRGSLKGVGLERAAVNLNTAFFSPRLIASRLTLLNPGYYAQLHPLVRKEAVKNLLSLAATGMTVLTLAKMGGAEVGSDPRSSDFGKIKVGDTRYDIWGGFQQYFVALSRIITGETVNSATGDVVGLGEKYGSRTRKDIIVDVLENKYSPTMGYINRLLEGKDPAGQPYNILEQTQELLTPLTITGAKDIIQERGVGSLPMQIPALFGVGVQTYGNTKRSGGKSRYKRKDGQATARPNVTSSTKPKKYKRKGS